MHFSSELLKGTTRQLLLAILSEQELYGYEIVKALRFKSKELITLGEGTVYPALHELEAKGFLKSRWVAQDKGPDRKYYRLTAKGAGHLEKAKVEWQRFTTAVNAILGTV